MTATDVAALSFAQTCTDAKVNEALLSAQTINTNYDECTKGLFRRRWKNIQNKNIKYEMSFK